MFIMAKYTHTIEKEHRENKLCVEIPMCHRPAVTGLHPFWSAGFSPGQSAMSLDAQTWYHDTSPTDTMLTFLVM